MCEISYFRTKKLRPEKDISAKVMQAPCSSATWTHSWPRNSRLLWPCVFMVELGYLQVSEKAGVGVEGLWRCLISLHIAHHQFTHVGTGVVTRH